MKLIVQIPCLNEEATLASVLSTIPRTLPGIDELEILVIDDGSDDRTVEVARENDVHHIISHTRRMGLARSFRDGVDYALSHGADIVVNTDGDNQYPQERIGDLVQPILDGTADIVIGDRQTHTISHFSLFKKTMQRFGSWVVNQAAGTELPDAASGFRAYSRYSLYKLNVVTQFSYTMETIIQAGNKSLAITSVEIDTNAKTRESRLFSNMFEHMLRSGQAILRSYIMFKPWAVFAGLTLLFGLLGLIPFVRYAILLSQGDQGNHFQSLILGTLLIIGAGLSLALGVLSDLAKTNRILGEDQLYRLKEQQYGPAQPAATAARALRPQDQRRRQAS
ncbi:glycosyltransferase family 2 protein [Demequina sp. TTPB684]|uniref:glycosyltransferase family 2 protein n=1 Tax=unclassified Demequina TaxID=2620311 RepID=UPI001CF26D3E|nr:glycosyltransferase family 2 protein [Demequina sp. TMPB413]MCB2412726.1 glycosyltransferase family 2 protein [Demequina sp. TTPB684]UPU87848.1 glycosyltransferase family 2 protein [Demequina sp. TMPB413]